MNKLFEAVDNLFSSQKAVEESFKKCSLCGDFDYIKEGETVCPSCKRKQELDEHIYPYQLKIKKKAYKNINTGETWTFYKQPLVNLKDEISYLYYIRDNDNHEILATQDVKEFNAKKKEILSDPNIVATFTESEDLTESDLDYDEFNPIEFEKQLPHEMRFKTYDFVGDKGLYWVTQEPFSQEDFDKFHEAIKNSEFDEAYVTVRDFSVYDFNEDRSNDILAYCNKEGKSIIEPYWAKVIEMGWDDELSHPEKDKSVTEADVSIDTSISKVDPNGDQSIARLIDFVQAVSDKYNADNIELWITPKGNINVRTKNTLKDGDDSKDIVTLDRSNFSDTDIDLFKSMGLFNNYMDQIGSDLTESDEKPSPRFEVGDEVIYDGIPSKIIKREYHPDYGYDYCVEQGDGFKTSARIIWVGDPEELEPKLEESNNNSRLSDERFETVSDILYKSMSEFPADQIIGLLDCEGMTNRDFIDIARKVLKDKYNIDYNKVLPGEDGCLTTRTESDESLFESTNLVQWSEEELKLVESANLDEVEVPASQLDFKHQQLAKVQSEIELIAGLKAEDTSNELYTDLLDAYDKIVEILTDAIAEDPVGTVVGAEEEPVTLDIEEGPGLEVAEEPTEETLESEDIKPTRMIESISIDPVMYVIDRLEGKEPETEFDQLCIDYKNTFDEMCGYNTVACDIYPGFDKENAESYLSPEDYAKFKEYYDKYNETRMKLRDISDKIDEIPDDEVGANAMDYYKTKYEAK